LEVNDGDSTQYPDCCIVTELPDSSNSKGGDTVTQPTRIWEYKVEGLDLSSTDILDLDEPISLDGLGAQGWELVSVLPNPTPGAAPFLCIFKRPSSH